MKSFGRFMSLVMAYNLLAAVTAQGQSSELPRLKKLSYNHDDNLVVDAAVGLWCQPLPMDWDGDGDLDLVMATDGVPSNGVYFYENVTGPAPGVKADPLRPSAPLDVVFKAGRRVLEGREDTTISYVDGRPMVCVPGESKVREAGSATPFGGAVATAAAGGSAELVVKECTGVVYPDFRKAGYEHGQTIGVVSQRAFRRTRGDQWKFG